MKPHPTVLRREPRTYQNILDFFGETVDEAVNFGTNLFVWLLGEKDLDLDRLTVALFLRHELELLDGISSLLKTGCDEPIRLLLRGAFEAHLGMLYIAEADSLQRALCYRVADLHRLITLAKRLDPSTPEGKQAQKAIDSDTSGFRIPREGHDTKNYVTGFEAKLRLPRLVPIEADWQRTRKVLGRRPDWFSLLDGPNTLEGLAVRLKHGAQYERLYRDWSGSVHASDLLERAESSGEGHISIRSLRRPSDLQTLAFLGVSIAVFGMRKIADRFATTGDYRLALWYTADFRDAYMKIGDEPMIVMEEQRPGQEGETAQEMAQDDSSATNPQDP